MRKTDQPTEVLEVTIDHIDNKGYGVARYFHPAKEGNTPRQLRLFIPNVVSEDVVRVTVPNAKGRRKAYLKFDELLKPGPTRNQSLAIENEDAGGTPLKYMTYEGQLEYKSDLIKYYFKKEAFDTGFIQPIIGMDTPYHYRNKMEFTFGKNGELGMHEARNYKNIIDIEDSMIAPEVMIEIKHTVSQWQKEHGLSGYNKDTHVGLLRNLVVRKSFATDELMVVLFATAGPEKYQEETADLVEKLSKKYKDLASLLWIVKDDVSEHKQAKAVHVLYGRDYIKDELNGYRYQIWYDTFFQASSKQAEKMVEIALEMAEIDSSSRVLDLFCGIGTFSLPFAQRAKELVGIELIESSIQSARRNAESAGLDNTHFFASDARKGLEKLKETWETPDVLVLNPPRSGAGGKLMRSVGRYGSQKVVYISCNPKTLAEDLKWLEDFGYELQVVQPIDQFPHTVHVENVCMLQLRDS